MWEYKCIELPVGERFVQDNEKELNKLGQDKWELISIIHNYNNFLPAVFFFKRSLTNQQFLKDR